jgi:hypothetical protein
MTKYFFVNVAQFERIPQLITVFKRQFSIGQRMASTLQVLWALLPDYFEQDDAARH